MRNKSGALTMMMAFLTGWTGLMFFLYTWIGVTWFHLGDLSYRTAMAYHGILIPAWMMLALAYSRDVAPSALMARLLPAGVVAASLLVGIGSALIHDQGLSPGTVIQVAGMILAELTVLVIIVASFRYHFRPGQHAVNTTAWWTVSIALIGLSLATPLGHLAGAFKDLGDRFPLFVKYATRLGLSPGDVVSGYIGSHSHQALASFLAAGFALPLLRRSCDKLNVACLIEKVGLVVMATATVAQVALYQYSAWVGWEPPSLFVNGPNGLPLDDFILVVLGLSMLLLIPGLLARKKQDSTADGNSGLVRGGVVLLVIAYLISVVALGLYIEFHEQYFGHGEGGAIGVQNDMAYIRAHLLYGFMIIPVLLGVLLSLHLLTTKRQQLFMAWFTSAVALTGFVGMFVWTFQLNASIIKISVALTALLLLVFAGQLARLRRGPMAFRDNH